MRHLATIAVLIGATSCALPFTMPSSADAPASAAPVSGVRATIYDDGAKLRGEPERPLPLSSYAAATQLEFFALPGETIALQVVIDSEEKLDGVIAELALRAPAPAATLTSYAEHFVRVERPSGNDREPGSLAFSAAAAPAREPYVGLLADALLPRPLDVEAHGRGALWIDVFVPEDAVAGTVDGTLVVSSKRGVVVERPLRLRVGSRAMPYAAAKVAVFYDAKTLDRRMESRAAEASLRHVLHAHHVSALPERIDPEAMDIDLDALTGALYTEAHGYRGPGQNVGEGVYAIGAYGSLKEPSADKLRVVERFVERIRQRGALEKTELFVYAVDEDCKSPRAKQWLALLERSPVRSHVRVGVTCDEKPATQDATLVMVPASSYDPKTANEGKARGKAVWSYNGIRPHAGPLMLDVPATDLRANAWIAMRYDVSRWFYWESTFWLDDNRGGRGGRDGWDPFVTAETFHNADGDYAMGDGILLYPGTQPARTPPMTDFGEAALYPSVRLKNIRRGVLDAGYVALAREMDRDRTDAIVRRMVPSALALVRDRERASWTDDAEAWRAARAELFTIVEGPFVKPPESTGRGPLAYAAMLVSILAVAALAGLGAFIRGVCRRRARP